MLALNSYITSWTLWRFFILRRFIFVPSQGSKGIFWRIEPKLTSIFYCFIFTICIKVAGANGSLNRELEHAVIVLKSTLDANAAPAAAPLAAPPRRGPMMPRCLCVHTSCLCAVLKPSPCRISSRVSSALGYPSPPADHGVIPMGTVRLISIFASQVLAAVNVAAPSTTEDTLNWK